MDACTTFTTSRCYEAIGLADDRNRRLHSIGRMVETVMILDAVLSDRRCWWLSPEADKRAFFDARETGCAQRSTRTSRSGGATKDHPLLSRQVAHRHREGRHQSVRVPLPREPAHTRGLPPVPHPSRRPVPQPPHLDGPTARAAAVQEGRGAVQSGPPRGALDSAESERQQVSGDVLSRTAGAGRTPRDPSDRYIAQEFRKQGMPKIPALYRAWRREGDVALGVVLDRASRRSDVRPFGLLRFQPLNRQYLQLTGSMDRDVWAKRGAKRKSRQVGPPVSAPSHDLSPLVAP